MKNIHVLPTNKPSRLSKDENDRIWLSINFEYGINDNNKQNIFITSNEKFNRDEYVTDGVEVIKATPKLVDAQGLVDRRDWKKIILTTDGDLIKEGVQSIDDEFLEWFVKNPSCEEVEIKKEYITPLGDIVETCYDNERLNYKIIIPKEEQKQHLIDMMKADEELGLYEENTKCYCGHTTYCDCGPEEPKQECMITTIIQMDAKMAYDSLPKQETLEEAAEFKSHHSEEDFIRGGRWQQEQDKKKYSEEEVGELITKAIKRTSEYCNINKLYGDTIEQFSKEWFDKNKKK